MEESKVLMEAKRCPVCHCQETVAREAFKVAEVEAPTGAYIAMEMKLIPLQSPALATLSIKSLITAYDVCLRCGTQYVTRAEVKKMPVQFQRPPSGFGGK